MKNCDYFNKKVNIEEAICLLEKKINELVEVQKKIDLDNKKVIAKLDEASKFFDFLIDEQGVKLPVMYDETKIEVGTIYQTTEGVLKFKKSTTQTVTINVT